MRFHATASSLVLLAMACTDSEPTSLGQATPDLAVAGNSGCYTVTVNSEASGVFPAFSGTTSGDIEADISTAFDVSATVVHGITIGNEGVTTWHVTGGIIPQLIGEVFEVSSDNLTLRQPDNDPLVFGINGVAKALSGVAKANLNFHGTFDARDLTPPFEVSLVWRGVICP